MNNSHYCRASASVVKRPLPSTHKAPGDMNHRGSHGYRTRPYPNPVRKDKLRPKTSVTSSGPLRASHQHFGQKSLSPHEEHADESVSIGGHVHRHCPTHGARHTTSLSPTQELCGTSSVSNIGASSESNIGASSESNTGATSESNSSASSESNTGTGFVSNTSASSESNTGISSVSNTGASFVSNTGTSSENNTSISSVSDTQRMRHTSSDNPNRGLCGLTNLGNSCYMNAALQCIGNTHLLTEYFLGDGRLYMKDINRGNPLGTGGALAEAYGNLMEKMWKEPLRHVNASDFKRQIGEFAPRFAGYQQQDAQELLVFLLDGLNEDLKKVHILPPVTSIDTPAVEVNGMEIWQQHLQQNDSVIAKLFHGLLKRTVHCLSCKNEFKMFEPFSTLSLPVSTESSLNRISTSEHSSLSNFTGGRIRTALRDCLDLFTQKRTMDAWYCSMCQTLVSADNKFELFMLPKILIIHLKRFSCHGYHREKIKARVRFPIRELVVDKSQDNPHCYDLFAVCNHNGGISGGHYTAFVRHRPSEQWYCYNDDHDPYQIREDQIVTTEAYLLFYEARET